LTQQWQRPAGVREAKVLGRDAEEGFEQMLVILIQ
jgi:hypothetical protein